MNVKNASTNISALQSDLQKMQAGSTAQTNSVKNVDVLLRTMEDNILKDKANGGQRQFIIFVKTIEVAKRLSEMLKIKAYTCESLIGTRGKYHKHEILLRFRKSKFKNTYIELEKMFKINFSYISVFFN